MNTFQAILATDGNQTFVMFLYEDIQWANFVTSIGFNAGDREESITHPESLTTEGVLNLENTTNVGIPGVYIFRVDQPMPGKVKKITGRFYCTTHGSQDTCIEWSAEGPLQSARLSMDLKVPSPHSR